jgi:hypothetical protein
VASAGAAGSRLASGSGGSGANTTTDNRGGDGGGFGLGGRTGISTDIQSGSFGFETLFLNGGRGGTAGEAFKGINGSTLTLTGSKSEATLRSEGRILGETSTNRIVVPSKFSVFGATTMGESNIAIGPVFKSDGNIDRDPGTGSITTTTTNWLNGSSAGVGASYEIRASSVAGQSDNTGVWLSRPTPGTWVSLSVNVPFYVDASYPTTESATHLVEIRRDDIAGVGIDDVMGSLFIEILAEAVI